MSLDVLKTKIPDYGKDIKLNLTSLLGGSEPLKLSKVQIAQLALSAAYATHQATLMQAFESFAKEQGLEEKNINAVKAAVALMAMTNVYYRSVNFIPSDTYKKSPANLRMHMLQKHGIDQTEFELCCVVVSAINGCEHCLASHVAVLEKAGIGSTEIRYSLRLASVIKGLAQILTIEEVPHS